ncbi:MAG: NAD(P)/FAD-dependent oxidoreductase [Actinomyces sp.]|nr:MAG: NAD(P)/FAD-dependent oxidoreductase [Actinomyces sp.]
MNESAFTASPFVSPRRPLTADDAEIRAALADAALQPLLPALAHLTGDLSLLRPHLRPDPLLVNQPQAGFDAEQQAEIRALALETLTAFRDGGSRPAPPPSDDDLLAIMSFALGDPGDTNGRPLADYLPLLAEEMAHGGVDPRAPDWTRDAVAPGRDFTVLVVGAGMSGILAAHRCDQAGLDWIVVDENDDVGGTWYQNTYPGCRVDNPNFTYSYSFAQRHDWPYHYSPQPVLLDYFRACADAWGIRDRVRYRTSVTAMAWDASTGQWVVDTSGPDGPGRLRVHAVISAVGQLNRPHIPDIAGLDTFTGPCFHSARWRHEVDLTGRRVAVIGTGASAVQFVPEIAPVCADLTVFQRTPPWLAPTEDYHDPVEPGMQWLLEHVPGYAEWNRFCIFWRMGDGALEAVRVDPAYRGCPDAVSDLNAFTRDLLTEYLRAAFADRPDLLEVVVPRYPVGAKRVVRDNGVWPAALKRDDVHLVTTPIDRVVPAGVVDADGRLHACDVLILATGFQASRFLAPMRVHGIDGVELHEAWAGEPRAHLGISVPGFPNLFLLYGPNTNIVLNGSIIYFSECGTRHILALLRRVLESGAAGISVRREVHDRFNEAVDAENARMAWGVSDVNSWYKNDSGRVSQNWPFTLLEYWERTRGANPDDYELHPAAS